MEFRFQLEVRTGYVFVTQHGKPTTEVEIVSMQRVIERAMEALGSRRVLFDNRDTEAPDEWIRASMWSWLCAHLDRGAMLQTTVRSAQRAVQTAERNRVAVRAFTDETEAAVWLMSGYGEQSAG